MNIDFFFQIRNSIHCPLLHIEIILCFTITALSVPLVYFLLCFYQKWTMIKMKH